MRGIFFAAWRNFVRNLHRYRVLLAALVIITLVLTVVLAVVLGLRASLHEKASRYFAGDAVVLGYIGDGDSQIDHVEEVLAAVEGLADGGVSVKTRSLRSTYYDQQNIELFFSGYWFKQRRLVGVEWDLERPVLEKFDFVEGSVPEEEDERGILISTATAEQLRVGLGDELLVSIRSDRGRTNTAELIVRGIYAESSFFGYTPYMHRRALNRLREAPEDRVNEVGVYLRDPLATQEEAARALAAKLAERLPSFGVLETREAYRDEARRKRDRREYGVVTVGAQLEEINDLLSAMALIAGTLIFMFLCIVVVGVSNTFAMIIWERTREIGTLRALGMGRGRTVLSFLIEAGILGLAGVVLGQLLAVGLMELFRLLFHFPPNFVSTLFLTQGRLRWILPEWGILMIGVLVLAASLLGSLRSALRAGRMRPVDALHRQG
ncbi:MAG TPA: ABC transporter permease [Sediminispirochaeta sp.]|nr:ABC transporter permease [Sediminispirochaeta sp.]